jgi:nitronate monooxygenase
MLGIKYHRSRYGLDRHGRARGGGFQCRRAGRSRFRDAPPESLGEEIRKTKALTDKPFGVNITLLPSMRELPNDGFVQVVREEGVPVVETSGGSPEKYIEPLKKANVKIMHKIGSIRHARNAEKLGVDAVIAVGFEGAGHPLMDDVSLWNLIPGMVNALKIPVLAAGGTSDYRQLTAALALGASAVVAGRSSWRRRVTCSSRL